jgi:hypothetical protein
MPVALKKKLGGFFFGNLVVCFCLFPKPVFSKRVDGVKSKELGLSCFE